MIEMPGVVADVVRSVGLSTAMKAAGVVTGLIPIPQPVLLVGPGASARLGEAVAGFRHRRVMVVTDAAVAVRGLAKPFLRALARGGTEHVLFDAVTADAPIPVIERGVALFRKRACDAIVAIGGGSPMDAAKVIAYAAANGKSPAALAGYFKGLRSPCPIYAVPTTAGTGSEVTVAAVISDPERGKKLVVADTRLVPAMAALDPELHAGLPPDVTAATGMDALTHAVEAFLGQWASEATDRLALAATGLVFAHLRTAQRSPRSLAAREHMALAATWAGLAFTRANVGYVHALAHQVGARYHVPHGLANAILLPHVLRALGPAVSKRLAILAVRAGAAAEGERPATAARRFIEAVEALNRDLAIPTAMPGLREEDIPALAKAACHEADTSYPVPKYLSPAECEAILRHVLPARAGPARKRRTAAASHREARPATRRRPGAGSGR